MSKEIEREQTTAASMETHYEVTRFLNEEAEILDDHRPVDWLERLTDDVSYEVPVRVTREVGDDVSEFSHEAYHYRENYDTLEVRAKRFEKDYAWAENPKTRTRRMVSNVRVQGTDGNEIHVKNNLVLHHIRGDQTQPKIISGERHDTLRRVDGELRIAERTVYLDQTVMGTENLSVFL